MKLCSVPGCIAECVTRRQRGRTIYRTKCREHYNAEQRRRVRKMRGSPLMWDIVIGQFAAKVLGGALWAWVLTRRERVETFTTR